MPKEIIDYSKTIIYKIVCNDLNIKDNYVGHTTNFIKRKQKHKNSCTTPQNSKYHLKVYQIIREYGGWENWSMIEIEKFPCNDKQEATKQERYWYEQLNAQLNTRNPNRNSREYRKDNKEILSEKKKIYHQNNKEILSEKKKIYHQNNKEKLNTYCNEYYYSNIAELKIKQKEYYENNKDNIHQRNNTVDHCICGSDYTHANKARHEKTKKHQDYITQQEI